jgi:protein-L-isoaspartate O-methyltransferase
VAIALYMDVHIPQAITDQLRRRGVDVLPVFDGEAQELPDDQLLLRVAQLNRVLFTQAIAHYRGFYASN